MRLLRPATPWGRVVVGYDTIIYAVAFGSQVLAGATSSRRLLVDRRICQDWLDLSRHAPAFSGLKSLSMTLLERTGESLRSSEDLPLID